MIANGRYYLSLLLFALKKLLVINSSRLCPAYLQFVTIYIEHVIDHKRKISQAIKEYEKIYISAIQQKRNKYAKREDDTIEILRMEILPIQ